MPVEFRGSYTVAVTPFTPDGSAIDVPALKAFLDWQLAENVPGIIMLGTTGEFVAVTDDERQLLVDETVKHIAGRIPVLVGAMAASTKEAVRRAGGNLAAAARALGMTRPQLSYRLSRTRDRTPQQKRE